MLSGYSTPMFRDPRICERPEWVKYRAVSTGGGGNSGYDVETDHEIAGPAHTHPAHHHHHHHPHVHVNAQHDSHDDDDGGDVDDSSDFEGVSDSEDTMSDEEDAEGTSTNNIKPTWRLREILFYDDKISVFKARHGRL